MRLIRARSLFNSIPVRSLTPALHFRHKSTQSAKIEQQITENLRSTTDGVYEPFGTKTKLPQRPPLVKNLTLGIVDKELLRFPEVISRDDTQKLTEELLPIQSYFKDTLDTKLIEQKKGIPKEVLEHLKSLGLFAFNTPKDYKGKEYSVSELSVASESEQASTDIAAVLLSHRVAVDVLTQFGSDSLKEKYLPQIANGSLIATEAVFESKPTDARFFGTTAEYDEMDRTWTLNGEKSFVIYGSQANLFLVLAQVNTMNQSGNMEDGISIFLVESNMPGVEVSATPAFGIRGSEQGTIKFVKVRVSEENVIGTEKDAAHIGQCLIRSNRMKTGTVCSGMLKNALRDLTDYAIRTKQNGIYLKDIKLVSDRLARMMCSIYAIESMIYLTAGLCDEFENQDTDLEAAILKLYALESLWKGSTLCLEFMGPKCLEESRSTEKYIRDAAQIYTQGETADSLRQYIGLSGIQYAGMHIHETIRKDRNPLFHPMYVFGKLFEKQSIDSPKMTLHLEAEVHPSLDTAAKLMEQSIHRLRYATEMLLGRYGSEIIHESLEIVRLAKCITLIFTMFASTARASRSYCIGLQHADNEMLMATIMCFKGAYRVKSITTDIMSGPFITNDRNNEKIAKQLFKSHQYFAEHPLKYNF